MLATIRIGSKINAATAQAVAEGAAVADKWFGPPGYYDRAPYDLPRVTRTGAPRLAHLREIARVARRKIELGVSPPRVYASMSPARNRSGDFGPLYCAQFTAGDPYDGTVALSVAWQPIGDEWMASVRGL